MLKEKENWLQKPNISWRLVAAVITVWFSLLLGIDRAEIFGDLKSSISRPFDFRTRELLGRTPSLNPTIKVFAIDDATVSYLGRPSPSTKQWADLLKAIDKSQPQMIVIDGLFSIADEPSGSLDVMQNAIASMEALKTPVYVGAFVAPAQISGRKELILSDPRYSYKNLIQAADQREVAILAKDVTRGHYVYGPDPRLNQALSRVGHIMYSGDTLISLFAHLDDRVLPHLMVAPWEAKLGENGFEINHKHVPSFPNAKVLVNLAPFRSYLKSTSSLITNFERSRRGESALGINPGDYVYIMPAFFTGNTDFKQTAFGIMPAGYIHLAVLNSILNDSWLKPVLAEEILLILACILGALLAKTVGPVGLGVGVGFGILGWLSLDVFLFSYYGVVLPWLLPAMGFLGSAVSLFVEKSRIADRKAQFIRNCLDGVISADQIENIAKNPELLTFSAREQVVTVMFIDVVGFSLVAENQLPRIAFDQLKFILGEITTTVHSHGGIVNKNLGDGLLCFFGYSIEQGRSTSDHAEKAIECAIEIQTKNLPKTIREYEKGLPVYPLRIGINTSSVFLGNIGTDDRIDLTIVGNGVNFAKRLEGACTIHSILMGTTTKELIQPLEKYNEGLSRRYIEIKHHMAMIESWEYDPFHNMPEQRAIALEAHKEAIARVREDERWEVPEDSPFVLRTNIGTGKVLNYSRKGMSIWLEIEVIVGTFLKVRLDDQTGELNKTMAQFGADVIVTEVCWCLPYLGGYTFGLKYRELSDIQLASLLHTLRKFSNIDDASVAIKSAS